MNTTQLVTSAYLKASGKLPAFASGSAKWLKIVAIANDKIDAWQNEPDANWNSLYEPAFAVGTVTANKSFALDDDIRILSDTFGDTIDITNLNGTVTNYQTIAASQLKLYPTGNYCAQIGRNLVFNKKFTTTDKQFGGSLTVPVYLYAPKLVADSDIVPVDDPQWLVAMTAAEYDRNDLLKQNQYPSLIGEANALMEGMKTVNNPQFEEVTRSVIARGMTW